MNPRFDLVLLKLNTPAFPVLMANHYVINTICLPKHLILNNVSEEALIAGFGGSDINNRKSPTLLSTVLIINSVDYCSDNVKLSSYYICGTESEHQTCYVSPFNKKNHMFDIYFI